MREMVSRSTLSCFSWEQIVGTTDRMTTREQTSRMEVFMVELFMDKRSGVGINRGLYISEAIHRCCGHGNETGKSQALRTILRTMRILGVPVCPGYCLAGGTFSLFSESTE